MNQTTWCLGYVAAAILSSAALIGCGSSESIQDSVTEKMIESAAKIQGYDMDVSLDSSNENASVSIKTEDGVITMETGTDLAVPGDFPEDVPLIEGLKLNFVQSLGKESMYSVNGVLGKQAREIHAYYEKALEDLGWEQRMRFVDPSGMSNMSYSKDSRMLNVVINPDPEEGATVSLTHMAE